MKILRNIEELNSYKKNNNKKTVGLIPTMGALHDGHLSLLQASKNKSDISIVSIFVNPTQFAPGEDFDSYPRQIELDLEKLRLSNADAVYLPQQNEIYPRPITLSTKISLPRVSKILCGKSRPHFFSGVLSVVLRLFNLVKPDFAFFGEKDFQQVHIIRTMVIDLHLNIDIISCPIYREKNGLAMSSRNKYLSNTEKDVAGILFKAMSEAVNLYSYGEKNCHSLIQTTKNILSKNPKIKIDYIDIRDSISLKKLPTINNNSRIFIAVFYGRTRLIDNLSFSTSSQNL